MYPENEKPQRGTLRRIFGKVAAVIAVAATLVFYGLGFQIGHAYYEQWQDNKAAATETWNATTPAADHTANLPWVAAGASMGLAYGAGFAGIALGKKKDRYYYGGGGSNYSSGGNDNFWLGYVLGSNNGGSRSSGSSSSKDNGGAAAALVIVGAAALAAGASVVSYKAVRANFGTGEPPIFAEEKRPSLTEIADSTFKPRIEETPAPAPVVVEAPASPPPNVEPSGTSNDPVVVDPALVKKWKPLAI